MKSSLDPSRLVSVGTMPDAAVVPGDTPVEAPAWPDATLDAPLRTAVMGTGIMGSGIAQCLATAGHDVACVDVDEGRLEAARERINSGRFGLGRAVERGRLTPQEAADTQRRLTFTTRIEALESPDLVIESVPEDLGLKIRVLRALDRTLPPSTVLASNTSGLPITALGEATGRPDRVVGWHWSSPATVMRFAEIVRTPATSDATIALVVAAARSCGKSPVVVNDQPLAWGFVANRVYFAMIREALRVVEEGVATREQVDRLMMDCFNWPSGPLDMLWRAREGWE